jgi:uncharacterized membrane protein
MLPRLQRILAAIELFALVIWTGGLFFFVILLQPLLSSSLGDNADLVWSVQHGVLKHFNRLEVVLAVVVLASNFSKAAIFIRHVPLLRGALLAASLMLVFTIGCTFTIEPRLAEKRAEIPSLNAIHGTPEMRQFDGLRRQYTVLAGANLMLGLFLVYSYRAFEERKLVLLARMIEAKPSP